MATTSEEENPMEFTRDKNQYLLIDAISTKNSTNNATTYEAKFVNPMSEIDIPVRIHTVNINNLKNISSFIDEIHEAETYQHENILKVHCSFKFNDDLWLVMPSVSRLSLRSVIQSDYQNGLSLTNVAFILKQTLAALNHMHANNKAHRSLDAGCIFLDSESRVKIALRSLTHEESGYPSWAVVCNKEGDGKAMDVWIFGLLALELFYGRIPVSDYAGFRGLVFGIEDEFGVVKEKRQGCSLGFFPCFRQGGRKKIPVALGELLAACFSRDPTKLATTDVLMEFELFKKSFDGVKSLAKLKKAWAN